MQNGLPHSFRHPVGKGGITYRLKVEFTAETGLVKLNRFPEIVFEFLEAIVPPRDLAPYDA